FQIACHAQRDPFLEATSLQLSLIFFRNRSDFIGIAISVSGGDRVEQRRISKGRRDVALREFNSSNQLPILCFREVRHLMRKPEMLCGDQQVLKRAAYADV